MKNTQKVLVRSILVGLFIVIGAGHTMATPWVRHNSTGWFDAQNRYHAYNYGFPAQPIQGNSPGVPERDLSDTAAAL